jgi:hypothetical protein
VRVIAMRRGRRFGVIGRCGLAIGMLGTRRVFGMRGVFLRVLGVFIMAVEIMRVIIMRMIFVGMSLMRVILVRVILVIVISMFVVGCRAGRGGGFDGRRRRFGLP